MPGKSYAVSADGEAAFAQLGIDLREIRAMRRHFARPCVDWSERRPHLGGALGAAVLSVALKKRWVVQDLDSRALQITGVGKRELKTRFGLEA